MLQVAQDLKALLDDTLSGGTLQVGDETQAARIAFILGDV